MKHLLPFFFFLIFLSCRNSTGSEPDRTAIAGLPEVIAVYADGYYCAEIKYYYPKTGTRSTYRLSVEIEDKVRSFGMFVFKASDKHRKY